MHRARSAARRTYHRAQGLLGGGGGGGLLGRLMPIGVGAAGQVAATVGNSFMTPWGGIAGLAGVGLVAKNETLMTLAGMHLAAQVPLPGVTTSGTSGGQNWL